jgi:hypothetical protein
MVCVHPTPPSTRRRLGQFLPEADGQDHDGSRDQPRHYQPVRNRPRSPALNAAQRVLPIPFGLIEETKRDVVAHRATRQQVKSPAGIILSHCYRLTYQRSIKQTIVFERVGSIYLWQTLSWATQELPHSLPFVQCGPFQPIVAEWRLRRSCRKRPEAATRPDLATVIFVVSHALPEAVVNPADLVLSPKEGLNKGLAQGRGALAVVHRPQYEMIGACWSVFEMSAPLIGRVADTLRPLAAQ